VPDYEAAERYNASRREVENYYRRLTTKPRPQRIRRPVGCISAPRTRGRSPGRPRARRAVRRVKATSSADPPDGESEPPAARLRPRATFAFALSLCAGCGRRLWLHPERGLVCTDPSCSGERA
jgi:hypothetical protein